MIKDNPNAMYTFDYKGRLMEVNQPRLVDKKVLSPRIQLNKSSDNLLSQPDASQSVYTSRSKGKQAEPPKKPPAFDPQKSIVAQL